MRILFFKLLKVAHYPIQLKKLAFLLFLVFAFSHQVNALDLDKNILKQVTQKFGKKATARLLYWQKIIVDAKGKIATEQLEITNSFFNQVRFLSDQEHWKKEDYWATPLEMLATNGGDCEDYSIAKYFTLREPLILDNLINEILPASQRKDLVPVYSFNGEGLWLSKLSSQEGKRIGNADKLKSWQESMTRHYRLFK